MPKQLNVFACLAPIALAAVMIIAVRAVLGFQFPVPWPDETGFIAPAFAFAHTGSLFDPGLNPDRVVMWMPPGYMVVLAAAFRLFGYSFALARWLSTAACLASLALVAGLAWRLTAGWRRVAACAAITVAFLSPYTAVSANIARMDMLLAALMLLALTACCTNRLYLAGACLAAGALVHFNAVYFAVPVGVAFAEAVVRQRRLPWPSRFEAAALTGAALAVALYAAHIAHHWAGFVADMSFQFAYKHFVSHADASHPIWPVLLAAALALPPLWRHRAGAAGIMALFGLAFVVMAYAGHEIWYDFAAPWGLALLTIAALALPPRRLAAIAAACAAAVLVMTATRVTAALRPLLPHRAMIHRSVVAPADIARIRAFIATLPPGATVDFGWSGLEPFFFADLARAGAHWTILRHSVTQVWPLRRADWRVVCDSSEWPPLVLRFDLDYPRHGQDRPCDIIATPPPPAAPK